MNETLKFSMGFLIMKRSEIKVGMKVIGNGGYEGTVMELSNWTNLIIVRYPGGEAMNDASDLRLVEEDSKEEIENLSLSEKLTLDLLADDNIKPKENYPMCWKVGNKVVTMGQIEDLYKMAMMRKEQFEKRINHK